MKLSAFGSSTAVKLKPVKILHTADWHMNSWLGRVDLSDDIKAALRQIAGYLEEHHVDVMLVAGDLFSERLRDAGMHDAISAIREIFGPFALRGGAILAVAGNHDAELKFETLRETLALGRGSERFVITAHPLLHVLEDAQGQKVQFVLMPYPTSRAYLDSNATYQTLEEKNRMVQANFGAALDALKARIDPNLPAVLVSHVHVRGAQGHSLYKISESDDVVFDPSQIPLEWVYAAYGHIHKPGPAVAGAPHVRYSGSPIALDAAERHDSKGCVLFEIVDGKIAGDLQILPLHGPRLHQLTIDLTREAPAVALSRLKDEIGAGDLVRYTLAYDPADEHPIAQIKAQINETLGRVYGGDEEVRHAAIGEAPLVPDAARERLDVPALVREYLAKNLSENSESAAILALAEELLAAGAHHNKDEC